MLKNRSFTAFGVSRSEIGIAGRNVTVTPWSGCDDISVKYTINVHFIFDIFLQICYTTVNLIFAL